MDKNNDLKPRVGLITLTESPRALTLVDEMEKAITKKHSDFKRFLSENEVDVFDASDFVKREKDRVGFYTSEDINLAIDFFNQNHVEAIVIGCWHWSEPMFVVEIARAMNRPILLYSDEDPAWAATCLITAAGASLWETSPNRASQVHERFYGDKEGVLRWIRGVCALEKMKRTKFILWGGSYALRMEYLQDDYPKLKSFLLDDILIEDQYILIREAEKISNQRIERFTSWLSGNSVRLNYDDRMFTPEVLKKQASLYFAAKDRIGSFGQNVGGVSVRCFSELSDVYGVDPCFLPAFIPYNEDSEGPKKAINTICEGDIKGLITMVLLSNMKSGAPSLFGDLSFIGKDYFIISNCGASSISYACSSCSTCEVLKNLTIEANCEGVSGGAVGYNCPPGEMTVARLVRSKGKYFMLAGLAESIDITPDISSRFYYGRTWPHAALKMNCDQQLFIQALGANHLVATFGNYVRELVYASTLAGIETFRIDSNTGIEAWLDRVRFLE